MAKIFLTGMTSAQCSSELNNRSLNFAGVMNKVLTSAGHTVAWGNPSVYMSKEQFSEYDAVIVGVSSATSLSSNRIYGALRLINDFWGDEKLTLFVDVPTVSQITASFKSFSLSEESFTKPFFSSRKEYDSVTGNKEIFDKVFSAARRLGNEDWANNTIYPSLPWKTRSLIKLSDSAKSRLFKVNLDSYLLSNQTLDLDTEKVAKWVCDQPNSKWSVAVQNHLLLPVVPMKWEKKIDDAQVFSQIARSSAALICPDQRDGTYWNYQYIQAMNAGVPIATQWQESYTVSESWGVLASNIDVMDESERKFLAASQKESYSKAIPNQKLALYLLERVIGVRKK
jgi:regulator of sigma D